MLCTVSSYVLLCGIMLYYVLCCLLAVLLFNVVYYAVSEKDADICSMSCYVLWYAIVKSGMYHIFIITFLCSSRRFRTRQTCKDMMSVPLVHTNKSDFKLKKVRKAMLPLSPKP